MSKCATIASIFRRQNRSGVTRWVGASSQGAQSGASLPGLLFGICAWNGRRRPDGPRLRKSDWSPGTGLRGPVAAEPAANIGKLVGQSRRLRCSGVTAATSVGFSGLREAESASGFCLAVNPHRTGLWHKTAAAANALGHDRKDPKSRLEHWALIRHSAVSWIEQSLNQGHTLGRALALASELDWGGRRYSPRTLEGWLYSGERKVLGRWSAKVAGTKESVGRSAHRQSRRSSNCVCNIPALPSAPWFASSGKWSFEVRYF